MPEDKNVGAQTGDLGAQGVLGAEPLATATEPPSSATTGQNQAPPAGGHPGEGQEPKKYAGRYDNVEDLEQGYLELRRHLSKQGTQDILGAVTGKPGEATQQPTVAQPQQPVDWSSVNESFRQSFEQNPLGTLQQLVQHLVMQGVQPLYESVTQQTLRTEAMRLAAQYPDFDTISPRIAKLLSEKPYLRQLVQSNPEALESVYQMARSALAAEALEAAKAAGREEGAQAAGVKAHGQTLPGGARKESKKPTIEEQIIQSIMGADSGTKSLFED